jgi:hypothetical protein
MARPDYASLLQFSEGWLGCGLLTEERLEVLGREFESSDDKNTEHYRYKVFREYLASRRPLPSSVADALYTLGEEDPDPGMGGSMMSDIVGLPECPAAVRERALSSGARHLISQVRRLEVLAELDRGLTPELFDRCLLDPDAVIHRVLAGRPELSRQQLERLAEAGANKAVRNMAAARLRSHR